MVSTWATLTGWALGATGHLNPTTYAWSVVVFILVLVFLCFKNRLGLLPIRRWRRPFLLQQRSQHSRQGYLFWIPSLFVLVVFLSLGGGLFFPPSNYDALSYRIPRMLHWLEAGRWHWISTPNARQNFSAPGCEWLMLPQMLFLKSDRTFFVLNWLSFLLLPGLIFRTFRLAGIGQKTCWWWMWLLPLGYGYVLQSGSIGNDAYATVYALASVCFVLSATGKERFLDFNLGILSVALLTGTKGSNLPLALPWLVAMGLRYKHWTPRFLQLLPAVALGLVVSYAPTALLNQHFSGSWTGDPMNETKAAVTNPLAGVMGNALMLGFSSVQPPLLVSPSRVNDLASHCLPPPFANWLLERFPRFVLKMGEVPMEESAGLGLGVIACLALWILLGRPAAGFRSGSLAPPWFFLGLAGLASLFFYMAKMGSESTARLLLPYYPLLLLLPLGFWRLPSRMARRGAPAFFLFAAPVILGLIASPARPLFPVEKLLTMIGKDPRFSRLRVVYETYGQRARCWDPLLGLLPPGIQTLGIFSHEDDLEAPLWKPYCGRQVVCANENHRSTHPLPWAQAWLARRPIAQKLQSSPQWDRCWRVAGSSSITQKASVGPEEWVLFLPR